MLRQWFEWCSHEEIVLAILIFALSAGVTADEGMWTFDNIPKAEIAKRYGVQLTDQWLSRVQKSVVRLETGCTASFVSVEGLVLTNHHCVAGCLADNSSAERDLIANGYVAARLEDELRCQGAQASVLMSTENVTDRVLKAIGDVEPAEATAVRNKVLTTLEANCEQASKQAGTPLACESVTLYQGGHTGSTVQALRGCAADVRARASDRRIWRRPGQFPVPSLVSRHVAAARVRERQTGIDARPSLH